MEINDKTIMEQGTEEIDCKEKTIVEDLTVENLDLPKSLVLRIAKASLPEGILIQKDAKQILTRITTFFVSYLGASIIESSNAIAARSSKTVRPSTTPQRIIITPELIFSALRDIDFDNFVKPLSLLAAERRKKNSAS